MAGLNSLLIKKGSPIKEVMGLINRSGLGLAIVTDEDNSLLGVITDGDIRRGILKGITVAEPVELVMNPNPIYAEKDSAQINLLLNQKIKGIPIVDSGRKVIDLAFFENKLIRFLSEAGQEQRFKSIERVLIIGGAGYIGSILVRKLLEKGYKVRVLDQFIYGEESLQGLDYPSLEIIRGDTRHIEILTRCLDNVDAVVHLAELVGDPACALNPVLTQETNYFAALLIASICKYYQINRFIYLSSCSVYGDSGEEGRLIEESPLNPVSLYAKMKISSEKALKELSDDNFLPTILRLSTVYGFSYRPRFDLVVNTLTAKAVREGKITIFGGTQWRPNVHVADVTKAITMVLEAPLEKVGNQIFNVGSDEQNYTISEIGKFIHEEIPSASLIIEDKVSDRRNYHVSFKKIREALNFEPDYSLKDGIKEIISALKTGRIENYQHPKYHNVKFLEANMILPESDSSKKIGFR